MPICDPSKQLPPLQGVTTLKAAGIDVTPAMQQWAASYAYGTAPGGGLYPIGSVFKRSFNGVPIVARVECHPFTVNKDGSITNGAYHGTTLYYATSPEMMAAVDPPQKAAPPPAKGSNVVENIFLASALFGTAFTIGRELFAARARAAATRARAR